MRPARILGSCSPFASDTENASIASPTPSSTLLNTNKKLHSIVKTPSAAYVLKNKTPCAALAAHRVLCYKTKDSMYSRLALHESRKLKQARRSPASMLTCCAPARLLLPHRISHIIPNFPQAVNAELLRIGKFSGTIDFVRAKIREKTHRMEKTCQSSKSFSATAPSTGAC